VGRSFPFTYQGRALRISSITVDEGWEVWVFEGDRKMVCAGRVSVDEAIDGFRRGEDPISKLAEQTKLEILSARVPLPPAASLL
jgi:hypothetical protein